MSEKATEKFVESDDITSLQILNNLLDGEINLDLKTQVHKPRKLSVLVAITKYLESINFKYSSNTLKVFIEQYLRYMVSFDRKSRKEIIKAISRPNPEVENLNNEFPLGFD